MAVRTTPVGGAVAGAQGAASQLNGAAGGWIGYVEVTADQTGITSEVAATGLTVGVTVGTSRRIRITLCCRMSSTVAGDSVQANIKESTTYLQLVQNTSGAANRGDTLVGHVVLTPSSGAHTYFVTMTRNGTGTITNTAAATSPSFLLVEDLGPA